MPRIHLTTFIHAPANRVFSLCRSIGLHKAFLRTLPFGDVEGGTNGFADQNDKISFSLHYLGRKRTLTSRITTFRPAEEFISTQVEGSFRALTHEQHFKAAENGTILIDVVDYILPFGFLGALADRMFFHAYLKRQLEDRNRFVKLYAESEKWKVIIPETNFV